MNTNIVAPQSFDES